MLDFASSAGAASSPAIAERAQSAPNVSLKFKLRDLDSGQKRPSLYPTTQFSLKIYDSGGENKIGR